MYSFSICSCSLVLLAALQHLQHWQPVAAASAICNLQHFQHWQHLQHLPPAAHVKDFTGREAIYYSLKFKYFSCNLVLLFSTCNTGNQLQLHQQCISCNLQHLQHRQPVKLHQKFTNMHHLQIAILICCTVSNPTLHARLPSIKYIRFSVESAVH